MNSENDNAKRKVLRIGIDGRWNANDFASSFSALDRLYTMRFGLAIGKGGKAIAERYGLIQSSQLFHGILELPPYAVYHENEFPIWITGRNAELSALLEPHERLLVQRVIYGSPGIKDLAGVGEIVGHIKDFLVHLIDLWSTKRQRELENERREIENQQLQYEVAKKFIEATRELNYSDHERRLLLASVIKEQEPITRLIIAGKITSADTIEEGHE